MFCRGRLFHSCWYSESFGGNGDAELGVLGLHRLAGQVGVEPHHVVRIDEVDREVPGLLGGRSSAGPLAFSHCTACAAVMASYW